MQLSQSQLPQKNIANTHATWSLPPKTTNALGQWPLPGAVQPSPVSPLKVVFSHVGQTQRPTLVMVPAVQNPIVSSQGSSALIPTQYVQPLSSNSKEVVKEKNER